MFQRQGKIAYNAKLDNSLAMDEYFDHPHKNFRSIHIAGTNGKGSVAHILASILQGAGFKTGLYTSPHLKDFRERIRVNGVPVPESKVIDLVTQNRELLDKIEPSFFEMSVAMALKHFSDEEVDMAVIETGMGGRLDSTNIITPVLSVITNIGMDHSIYLGNSLEKIAYEKAGIIKPGVPVVVGETDKETDHVFIDKARETGSEIVFADRNFSSEYSFISLDGLQVMNIEKKGGEGYPELKIDLNGIYQRKNVITTLQVVEKLNEIELRISLESLYKGMRLVRKNTGFRGRWEVLENNPLIVCDTGHNREGLILVIEQIKQTAWRNLHMVIGMVNDKNMANILPLFPVEANYYFCRPDIPRGLDSEILKNEAAGYELAGQSYGTVKAALDAAKQQAGKQDMIFVGGSTFVVAEVL
ncbi:MAG: bifunctional folylpolyglutamate synthase/dihydrofolate synthase [Bacteroidetes bacterium]|nr:bifunctional folylpolyglutamate synthase/dihydrofolate synthase [Bacteroidota bacterium]